VADDLSNRLISLFLDDGDGRRPAFGSYQKLQRDPIWHDRILFFEYFHGDTGAGLGASHQTGWTGLVADLILSLSDPSLSIDVAVASVIDQARARDAAGL
jgi:hypothetical protein